nr:hypothetical protein [Mucilaginibacter sp. E4BP6]
MLKRPTDAVGYRLGNQNGIFFFSIENKNLTLTPLNGG